MARVLTSATNPLRIDTLPIPGTAGCIGLTFCPGKNHFGAETGDWERDLETDLRAVVDWRAETLVTLMELDELAFFGVRGLPDAIRRHGLSWLHLPIVDMSVPDERFELLWSTVGHDLLTTLRHGGRVAVHCLGGKGRTGLFAALVLREFGFDTEEAIRSVRDARTGTIQTRAQERYVEAYTPRFGEAPE